jgi:hypothetical protein
MLLATHALAGAILGTLINNPLIAFLIGIASHFILDAIPHIDFPDYKKGSDFPYKYNKQKISWPQFNWVAINTLLTILTIAYLLIFYEKSPAYLWGIFGAILPDILEDFPYLKYKYKTITPFKQIHIFHGKIQSIKPPKSWGIFIQYIAGIILVLILLKIK